GLTGFEWGIGVPGTVGGSVRGNAGCFGREMKDMIDSVQVSNVNVEHWKFDIFPVSACEFSYRESIFKKRPELIVLSATLKLERGDVNEARKRLAEYTKRRIESQDIGAKTAGSVFKNVRWEGKMPEGRKFAGSGPKENAAVGYLLESAGLKGFSIGGAKFSEKHANFILNTGNATAEDIVQLIALAKERVFEQFGIRLEEEIQYVGF
ncbi:MAG: UDP-N-acetylmuramate dehydrogenase, partial [Patescibacteria group bacterium]